MVDSADMRGQMHDFINHMRSEQGHPKFEATQYFEVLAKYTLKFQHVFNIIFTVINRFFTLSSLQLNMLNIVKLYKKKGMDQDNMWSKLTCWSVG